jgi:hypothetical protein
MIVEQSRKNGYFKRDMKKAVNQRACTLILVADMSVSTLPGKAGAIQGAATKQALKHKNTIPGKFPFPGRCDLNPAESMR